MQVCGCVSAGVQVCGCMDVCGWVGVNAGVQVCGCMDVCVWVCKCRCAGVWVYGCVCGCVWVCKCRCVGVYGAVAQCVRDSPYLSFHLPLCCKVLQSHLSNRHTVIVLTTTTPEHGQRKDWSKVVLSNITATLRMCVHKYVCTHHSSHCLRWWKVPVASVKHLNNL